MNLTTKTAVIGLVLGAWVVGHADAAALTICEKGEPKAAIWHCGDAKLAASDLESTLNAMTGAEWAVKTVEPGTAPPDGIAIVLGQFAIDAGLEPPPQTASGDGYRLALRGNRVLMAGETERSTAYAASHFLRLQGCRWFFASKLGTVIPRKTTIRVDEFHIVEKPDFLCRSMWGPNLRPAEWARRNRLGGLSMPTGHDWAHVPAATYGETHPEYYAMRGGERRPGNWVCTSNPDVQKIFADSILESVKGKGPTAVSVSPPDGRGYCQCDRCTALDDPSYLEPSSGSVAISDRYQRFYNAVGKQVFERNPDCILNFYAYADYSRPPLHAEKGPPNLCAWIAPIRYCRLHSLTNPSCKARLRLRDEIGQWQKIVSKLGWREYNYNLAELTAPLSKISVLKEDIPLLHKAGCIGINIECLFHWHQYGPHTYLATRMLWDADADVDAVMDDFYSTFAGRAAPHVKAYWERMDRAYRETDIHVGSFYGLHVVWTPDLVAACESDLTAAAKAADDEVIRERVRMFQAGLDNVKYYLDLRSATCAGDFVKAKSVYDNWLKHMDDIHAARYHRIGEYKRGYVPRFLGGAVNAGYARVTGENNRLALLPDEWLFRYDTEGNGEANGWHLEKADSAGWQPVRTCSATLAEQGVEEVLGLMWYRTEFKAPKPPKNRALYLWFGEVDGRPTKVFLNGEAVGESTARRKPFDIDVTGNVRKGKNTVAVLVDHSSISELALGGIIKPVMLYSSPMPEQ